MYCHNCGKEIPTGSNYCPNCGTSQRGIKRTSSIFSCFFALCNEYRGLLYFYGGWILLHLALWIFANPMQYSSWTGNKHDISDRFYPFNCSISEIIKGSGNVTISPVENCNAYDFSEFFFYTILLPVIFLGIKKQFPSFFTKAKMYHIWQFVKNSKISIVVWGYAIWCVIHIVIYSISPPNNYKLFSKEHFYPFNDTFKNVITKGFDECSLTYIGSYDSSELFFYVLLPIIIFCIVKLCCLVFRTIKNYYRRVKTEGIKSINDCNINVDAYVQPLIKEETITNVFDDISSKNESNNIEIIDLENICSQEEQRGITQQSVTQTPNIVITKEQSFIVEEKEKMSLFSRFIGSAVDKILILILFVLGFAVISPYGVGGKLGTYYGLRNTSPSLYKYIDKNKMSEYNSGHYYENYHGIDKDFLDKARQTEEPPHIGSTLKLDLKITFSFIILNLIYYLLFECILSASLGKWLWNGIIFDESQNKIRYKRVLIRALYGAVLMSLSVFVFHILLDLCNSIVIILFFIIMDIPVLFTKRSLLDLWTNTTYVER